jgi:hypothetical protein
MMRQRFVGLRILEFLAAVLAAAGRLGELLASLRLAGTHAPVEDPVGRVQVGVVVPVVRTRVDRVRVPVDELLNLDVIERRQRGGAARPLRLHDDER